MENHMSIGNNGYPGSVYHTPEGGIAIRMFNKTGGASVKGTLVDTQASIDFAVKIAVADDDDVMGVIYDSGVADGDLVWVVVCGVADVLLEDLSTATRGYWCRTSITQAGRADITNPNPPASGIIVEIQEHFREIGHCLESVTAGTDKLARVVLHFN
jgi:hypothetical protein